jgi:hypothetical protein
MSVRPIGLYASARHGLRGRQALLEDSQVESHLNDSLRETTERKSFPG